MIGKNKINWYVTSKGNQNEVVKYMLKALINYKLWTHPKIYFYANKIPWNLFVKDTSKWFGDITFPKALPVLHSKGFQCEQGSIESKPKQPA